jgi:predicted HTH transcriptional regulator
MIELLTNLADWTFDTVLEIVGQHEYEPGYFDYKLALNATNPDPKKRDEHLTSLRRTVCAMANSGGGFLLFGIRDRNQNVAKPEDRIVGIPVGGDLLRDFGSKVADLQPPVFFEATPRLISLTQDKTRGIFIVRIPESHRRPHMVRSTGAFYRRGDGGTAEIMDFYQIRDLMLMRRQAHLENLKWELEENIAAMCRKHKDLPSPAHSWLWSGRSNVKLTDSDHSPL